MSAARVGKAGLTFLALFAALPVACQPSGADLQAQEWAFSCMACHGPDGRAEAPGRELAGRPASDLHQKLIDFKRGDSPSTVMGQHAKGYSDAELRRIAEVFSRLKRPTHDGTPSR